MYPHLLDLSDSFTSQTDCRTPRRNRDVRNALDYFDKLSSWCHRVDEYLKNMMQFEQNSRPSHDGFFAKRDLAGITISVRQLVNNYLHAPIAVPFQCSAQSITGGRRWYTWGVVVADVSVLRVN